MVSDDPLEEAGSAFFELSSDVGSGLLGVMIVTEAVEGGMAFQVTQTDR